MDIKNSSQREYAEDMVLEEYLATTRQYQFFVALDVNSHLPKDLALMDMPPRYDEYRSAYDFGVKCAARVTSDPSRLHLSGIINANRILKIYIHAGGLGVGALTYREHYAREWRWVNESKNP